MGEIVHQLLILFCVRQRNVEKLSLTGDRKSIEQLMCIMLIVIVRQHDRIFPLQISFDVIDTANARRFRFLRRMRLLQERFHLVLLIKRLDLRIDAMKGNIVQCERDRGIHLDRCQFLGHLCRFAAVCQLFLQLAFDLIDVCVDVVHAVVAV